MFEYIVDYSQGSNYVKYVQEGIPFNAEACEGTKVHVAVDGRYAGFIIISDEVKEDSPKAVKALRDIGVKRIAMLTGDVESACTGIAG